VYDRRIAGKELTFGVSGKLHANSLIMYDHQTESLWSHLVGAAVTGPLKEKTLKIINSMFTKWGTWKKLYPDSKILSSGRNSLFGFGSLRDPYESYYRSSDTGIRPTRLLDRQIYPKEYILGLVVDNKAKAYPFGALSRSPVVNDTFQGVPLLVTFEAKTATGVVFQRKVEGKILSFKKSQHSDKKGFFLVDEETGTVWEALTGKAARGRLKGRKLAPLPVTPSFWFGWVDHYPDTELYSVKK
jgi:hypothetical protein